MAGAPMLSEHVLELAVATGLSREWRPFHWEVLKNGGAEEAAAYKVEGAVAPVITRGKRKGSRAWKRLDHTTRRVFYVTPDQHRKWLAKFEATTGKCFNCSGEGREFAAWSVSEGTKYRPCSRCKGTGSAPGRSHDA